MKDRPKKTKKYSHIKDCKEQFREIHNQHNDMKGKKGVVYDKKSIQTCHNTPRKIQEEVCKTDVHRHCKRFSNIFLSPVKKQNCHFEPKKINKLEMKTYTKKTKKYIPSGVNKSCNNTHRKTQVEICKTGVRRNCEKVSNIFIFPVKKQNYHSGLKKIKDCKEQPTEIHDTQERLVCSYEPGENCKNVTVLGTNTVVKQPTQNFYNIPRKTQAKVCKTDVHRYVEKFSNVLPLPVKKQNYHFKPKKICEFEMRICPKKTKKDSYTKDCKEQPREICEKKSIQPLCDTQERLVRIHEPTENEEITNQGQNTGSWNQCCTLRPNEDNCEKFPNSFHLPVKEQIYRFERKKTYELEMKTCPKKTKENNYIKDCKEQPRKILLIKEQIYCFEPKKIYELEMKKFSNSFFLLAKEQIYSFEPKKIYELEMKTRPEKTKKDSYIKDCKEQPREICDQCDIQSLCNTQERMVCTYETNRK